MSSTTTSEKRSRASEAGCRGVRLVRAFAVLGGLSQSLAGAAAALLAKDVAGSDAGGGLPQSLLVVGAGVSALGLAALTRRWDRALALAVGAMTAAVGCVAMALGGAANALVPVVAGSLLLGAGNTAVMLSRYAAAELDTGRSAPRAMASVLVATSVGAVLGPNLLQPSGLLMQPFDVSPLIGSYAVAGLVYAAGAGVVLRARAAFRPPIPPEPNPTGPSPGPFVPAPSTGSLRHHPAGRVGLVMLSIANLVMVGVMTMAPVHLAHVGGGLWLIGLVISAHIGAMFGPSALSGWLTERIGAHATAHVSAVVLVAACVLAALAGHSALTLAVAMVILGLGWNAALVSGSALLTHGVPAAARPARESLGEVGMAVAATVGGAVSGLTMASWDYATLALLGTVASALLLAWLVLGPFITARLVARPNTHC